MTERVGTAISLGIACIGTINNTFSISFFLRRKNGSIGDKFMIFVNTLDTIICLWLLLVLSLTVQSQEKGVGSPAYNFGIWTIFGMLIELSGLATCFLCALRTISINWPLYQINKTKVYILAVLAVAYIIIFRSVCFHPILKNYIIEKGQAGEVSFVGISSFCNISFMIVFVLVCSIASTKALLKTRPEMSGQRSERNEKATKMVLILGLLFVTFNTVWIILKLTYYLATDDDGEGESSTKNSGVQGIVTYFITCTNSAVNPIVYMTRNAEMNDYLKQTFLQVTNVICKPCSPNRVQEEVKIDQ